MHRQAYSFVYIIFKQKPIVIYTALHSAFSTACLRLLSVLKCMDLPHFLSFNDLVTIYDAPDLCPALSIYHILNEPLLCSRHGSSLRFLILSTIDIRGQIILCCWEKVNSKKATWEGTLWSPEEPFESDVEKAITWLYNTAQYRETQFIRPFPTLDI